MDDLEQQINKIITNLKKNPNREYTGAHIEKLKNQREQLWDKVKKFGTDFWDRMDSKKNYRLGCV